MTALVVLGRLGNQPVAFAAEEVEAAVDLGPVVPVPLAPPHFRGLAAVRSQVLTVIDAGLAVGEAPAAGMRALVVDVEGHRYALLVDAVDEVVMPDEQHPAAAAPLGARWSGAAKGMVQAGGALHLLLSPTGLIAGAP